ncbi:MAG: DUF4845 domain-containing protein [Proteobacteria bacterium]|nr:DUF4845 domain-containing protein [Pseudomonadota bacterium]
MNKLNINNLKKQQGVSKLGLLVMFFLVAVFLTAGLKVVPLYIDHNLIVGVCDELIETGEADNMTISDIRIRVSNTLRINNVTGFDLRSITLRRENSQAIITVAYERRVELFANLDVIAKFDSVLQ